MGNFNVVGCLDDHPDRIGHEILGIPVIGPISQASFEDLHIKHAVIAIGSNVTRKRLAEYAPESVDWITLVHRHAYVAGSARIGKGTVIFAGAVIQPNVRIGSHVILNTSASIDHDGQLQDYVHVAPGSHLAGAVTVNEGTLVGIGSTIVENTLIGSWAVIGAGAVVTQDVPPNATAIGIPAKVVETRIAGWHVV